MNYYCLVAGLPDLQKEDSKGFLSLEELREEISGQLTPSDVDLLNLLYAKFDNANFLKYLKNRDSVLDPLGVLKSDDWEELVLLMQEVEQPKDERLLPYIVEYYNFIQAEDHFAKEIAPEDYLSGLYYAYAMQVDNQFMKDWFEFNLNLNNLLTAIFCRKHSIQPEKLIIGKNEISSNLKTSHARDFGIGNLFEYADEVFKIAEERDLLEREKKIDALKWFWLEEHTFFHYFSIEKILAYTLKVEMLQRWKMLSFESGSEIFRNLLVSLKEGIEIEV